MYSKKKILRHYLWRHVIQCECNFLCLFPTAAVVSGIQRETSPTLTSFFFAFLGFSLVCKCIGTTTNVYVIVSTAVPSLKVLLPQCKCISWARQFARLWCCIFISHTLLVTIWQLRILHCILAGVEDECLLWDELCVGVREGKGQAGHTVCKLSHKVLTLKKRIKITKKTRFMLKV